MQVFEYSINPELKKDFTFETVTLNPKNIYGKRLGHLFMMSSLDNAFFQNKEFLTELLIYLKEKYYRSAVKTPEKALKASLIDVNSFLEDKTREGSVEWLGNLGLITLAEKAGKVHFAKTGKTKLLLFRGNEITDVDSRIKRAKRDQVKTFGDMVSAKLNKEDCLLFLTKELHEFLRKNNLLEELAKVAIAKPEEIETFINSFENKLNNVTGSFLIIVFDNKEKFLHEKKILKFEKKVEEKKTILSFLSVFKNLSIPKIKLKEGPIFRIPELVFNKKTKKIGLIIGSTSLLLILGFFLFQIQKKAEINKYLSIISEIETEFNETNIIEDESKKESLMVDILNEYNNNFKDVKKTLPSAIQEKKLELENKIYGSLYELNSAEVLTNPKLITSFSSEERLKGVSAAKGRTYTFNDNKVYRTLSGEQTLINEDGLIKLSLLVGNEIIFISEDLKLYREQSNSLSKITSLSKKYNYSPTEVTSYVSNLYFLDKEKGNILKFSHLYGDTWAVPEYWFNNDGAINNSRSIAIDKNIWILKNDNTLEKYYLGKLRDSFSVDTFPAPTNFTKIFTARETPYIFILEGSNNRVLVVNKTGKVVKQYISDKFSNSIDFSVDLDNNLIQVLTSAQEVYEIKLEI
jgi:dihydroxyacetone kinase DhaKLM complex PTS-EIIA-like component DhaM